MNQELQAEATLSTIKPKNCILRENIVLFVFWPVLTTSSKGEGKLINFPLWMFGRRQRHLTEAVLAALLEDCTLFVIAMRTWCSVKIKNKILKKALKFREWTLSFLSVSPQLLPLNVYSTVLRPNNKGSRSSGEQWLARMPTVQMKVRESGQDGRVDAGQEVLIADQQGRSSSEWKQTTQTAQIHTHSCQTASRLPICGGEAHCYAKPRLLLRTKTFNTFKMLFYPYFFTSADEVSLACACVCAHA